MRKPLAAITVAFTWLMSVTSASAATLFDSTSNPSQTPAQQGWSLLGTKIATAPSATASSEGTIFDTGNALNYAGYVRSSPFTLDRKKGYSISFSLKINSESHSNNNSAGFNIVVMSSRANNEKQQYGIELCFWENSIWAKNAGFTHGEEASFNNQADVNNYTLFVKDEEYKLYVNGSAMPILKGRLRQYAGLADPYSTPNAIFMGDESSFATAQVTIKKVTGTPATQVTLPNNPSK